MTVLINEASNFSNYNVDSVFFELSNLNKVVFLIDKFNFSLKELFDFFELSSETSDYVILSEILCKIDEYKAIFFKFEMESFFYNVNDKCNSFLEIQAGSGGIDAQDCAGMLLNMYSCWAYRNKFKFELLDTVFGDIAGIKSASVKVIGEYAYGWLKLESGIHRLVRKSPFDSNNKRHTSFVSVFVYPDNYKQLTINLNESDLRIDTYRASGAGGQHVNKTDSAVRVTHKPTNIVVQCQSERSQHRNKSQAIDQLKSKLSNLESINKKNYKMSYEKNKLDIAWGNQIRSYVLDQSYVRDLRSGLELNNVKLVLDGNIEPFMFSVLDKL